MSVEVIDALQQVLEKEGILAEIRAKLRASVYNIIRKSNSTTTLSRPNKISTFSADVNGMRSLVVLRDCLKNLQLNETLAVFDAEIGLELPHDRESIIEDLSIKAQQNTSPIIFLILESMTKSNESKLVYGQDASGTSHSYFADEKKVSLTEVGDLSPKDSRVNDSFEKSIAEDVPEEDEDFPAMAAIAKDEKSDDHIAARRTVSDMKSTRTMRVGELNREILETSLTDFDDDAPKKININRYSGSTTRASTGWGNDARDIDDDNFFTDSPTSPMTRVQIDSMQSSVPTTAQTNNSFEEDIEEIHHIDTAARPPSRDKFSDDPADLQESFDSSGSGSSAGREEETDMLQTSLRSNQEDEHDYAAEMSSKSKSDRVEDLESSNDEDEYDFGVNSPVALKSHASLAPSSVSSASLPPVPLFDKRNTELETKSTGEKAEEGDDYGEDFEEEDAGSIEEEVEEVEDEDVSFGDENSSDESGNNFGASLNGGGSAHTQPASMMARSKSGILPSVQSGLKAPGQVESEPFDDYDFDTNVDTKPTGPTGGVDNAALGRLSGSTVASSRFKFDNDFELDDASVVSEEDAMDFSVGDEKIFGDDDDDEDSFSFSGDKSAKRPPRGAHTVGGAGTLRQPTRSNAASSLAESGGGSELEFSVTDQELSGSQGFDSYGGTKLDSTGYDYATSALPPKRGW